MPSRRSTLRWTAAAAMLLVVGACARKAPPSGGPPDIEPPTIVSAAPESGAAHVPADARLSITFSEGMEPRATAEAVAIAPRTEIRQRRWNGRTLTLVLGEPLKPRQTYTLFVGNGARDRHGNTLETGGAVVFSTADTFPPGVLEGAIEAHGFSAPGTYLWLYSGGRQPDSTARDFDALGVADENGHFRVTGLPVPGRYRLWAFADLNRNRSFEPQADILAPSDTTLDLTAGRPIARDLHLTVTNPRAPGKVAGAVVDSTGDTLGVIRVVAISERDSTDRRLVDADERGAFHFDDLGEATWLLRAFRDDDRNRAWRVDVEPASPVERVRIDPAADIKGVTLRLRFGLGLAPPGGPSPER